MLVSAYNGRMSAVTKKFLDPRQIDSAIAEVAGLAAKQGVHVALAGGAAMQLYGSQRFTKDVDFLAGRMLDGLTEVAPLSFGGASLLSSTSVPVDIIVRNDDYADLYDAALVHARFEPELGVFVVTPEYLAAMKFEAKRSKDLEDLRHLLLQEQADLDAVRRVFQEFFGRYVATRELAALIAEYRWLATQGK